MTSYILADNQDLTRFALECIVRQDERNTVRRATDRGSLLALLKEAENSVVVRFWVVSLVCSLLAVATLKVR